MTSYASLISDIQSWTQNQSAELSEERDTIYDLDAPALVARGQSFPRAGN